MTQPYDGQDRRTPPPAKDPGWHLDKKVPLTLIFAMLMQAAMVIWAIADIKKDVEVLKSQSMTSTFLRSDAITVAITIEIRVLSFIEFT